MTARSSIIPKAGEIWWPKKNKVFRRIQQNRKRPIFLTCGNRPVLVLSCDKYNEQDTTCVVVPLSTHDSSLEERLNFVGKDGKTSYVIHRDIRTVNMYDLEYYVDKVDTETFNKISNKVTNSIFGIENKNN